MKRETPSITRELKAAIAVGAPALVLASVVEIVMPFRLSFLGRFWGVGAAVGAILFFLAIGWWLAAAMPLLRARKHDRLAAGGAYGVCRHPLYTMWLLILLPAAALFFNNLLFLIVDVLIFFPLRRVAIKEEISCAARHPEYDAYAERVRRFVPLPRFTPLSMGRLAGVAGLAVLVAFLSLIGFYAFARPVVLGLGVSSDYRRAPMPGDGFIRDARQGYTQGIEIAAPPEAVWPWLAQMGYKRAGWYNIDLINKVADPDYFFEGTRSAERIIPQLQEVEEGDVIYLVPEVGMVVTAALAPERFVLVGNPTDPQAETNAVWSYVVEPTGVERSKLIVRFASTFPDGFSARIINGIVNEIGGAIIQQPANLAGIKKRAEAAWRGRTRTGRDATGADSAAR